MKIERLVLGDFATNCYLVSATGTGACLVIDPAGNDAKLLARIDALGQIPQAVLLTHGHYDHILAVPALQQRRPELPVYCHPLDCPKEREEHDMGQVFPTVTAFSHVQPLTDAQQLTLAGLSVQVLHTPGHTPGSVTFRINDVLFSGDTLFYHSIGRTDFPGGDGRQMTLSLARLGGLAGDLPVHPGHDDPTSLAAERKHNPWMLQALANSKA